MCAMNVNRVSQHTVNTQWEDGLNEVEGEGELAEASASCSSDESAVDVSIADLNRNSFQSS